MKKRLYEKRLNEKIGPVLTGILLLVIILITSAQAVCYWIPDWWRNEYAGYDTPQYVTGEISLDDSVYITEQMLEYCIGRLDTLDDTEATIDGVTSPFFTDREKSHLSDCRNIFLAAVRFRLIAILVSIGLLIGIRFAVRSRMEAAEESYMDDPSFSVKLRKEYLRVLSKGYLTALAAVIILTFIIVMIGMHDFTFLFTKFHELFFDNDLWILDPHVDNLVNIMQESVFSDAAVTIATIWGIAALLLAALAGIILYRSHARDPKQA